MRDGNIQTQKEDVRSASPARRPETQRVHECGNRHTPKTVSSWHTPLGKSVGNYMHTLNKKHIYTLHAAAVASWNKTGT